MVLMLSFSSLPLLIGQSTVVTSFVGWFLRDWYLQSCCSWITVGRSPPSRQTASILTLSLGQEGPTGLWQLVTLTRAQSR